MVLNVLFALAILSNQRNKDAHCRYTNNINVRMHTNTFKDENNKQQNSKRNEQRNNNSAKG